MEKMLVVIFDNESKAYEGSKALMQLDAEGSITIHAEAVIKKNPDGTVTVMQSDGDYPIRTVSGTAIGSIIGLLGGPIGLGIGAAAGALAGGISDLNVAGVNADFLNDVGASLTTGKCAVIADVSEEWVTPVDTRMEALGGSGFRTSRKVVEQDQWSRDVASLRAEIDQLKAEHTRASADRKAKLQAKIDQLNVNLQAKLDQVKRRSDQIDRETEAKVQVLQKKAHKAQGEIKATLEARAKRIREDYEQFVAEQKHLVAGHLRAAAAKFEK